MTAVRMFYHRINELMRLLNSPANPLGKITDYFYRVEFQQRGAPHIHCLFWVKEAPKFDQDSDEAVCSFIDRYVCARNVDESDELHKCIACMECQHGHPICYGCLQLCDVYSELHQQK